MSSFTLWRVSITVDSIWWSNSADFWPTKWNWAGFAGDWKEKSKICNSACRSSNDQEMYDQMEQNLIDLSHRGKVHCSLLRACWAQGKISMVEGKIWLSSQLKIEQHYSERNGSVPKVDQEAPRCRFGEGKCVKNQQKNCLSNDSDLQMPNECCPQ